MNLDSLLGFLYCSSTVLLKYIKKTFLIYQNQYILKTQHGQNQKSSRESGLVNRYTHICSLVLILKLENHLTEFNSVLLYLLFITCPLIFNFRMNWWATNNYFLAFVRFCVNFQKRLVIKSSSWTDISF